MEHTFIVIDLKSFFASVECAERGMDPMTENLVVADPTRTDKTICLAVTPAMKALGVKNRCRVFEIPKSIKYVMAPPRMSLYLDYAGRIYGIYLRHISPEDIHVYSIDEAFIDVTPYLGIMHMTPRQIAVFLMETIHDELGIRATCGIGTNMYLAKIALDITAKHSPDFIGELDEDSYRRTLWDHRPLTDFWRIGPGTAKRLDKYGIHTMGQLAHTDEDWLYKEFGVDAELLIDHAWGEEPATIADIKAYHGKSTSLSNGQVMGTPYGYQKARLIVREMTDALCLDMVAKHMVTQSVTVLVNYEGDDPRHDFDNATATWETPTNADSVIIPAVLEAFDRMADRTREIRRFNVCANNTMDEHSGFQLGLFDAAGPDDRGNKAQKAVVQLKGKFGTDVIFKGTEYEEGSTARQRKHQIGGHSSGT